MNCNSCAKFKLLLCFQQENNRLIDKPNSKRGEVIYLPTATPAVKIVIADAIAPIISTTIIIAEPKRALQPANVTK